MSAAATTRVVARALSLAVPVALVVGPLAGMASAAPKPHKQKAPLTVTQTPPALTNTTAALFGWSTSGVTETFTCSLNGVAQSCTSPFSYPTATATPRDGSNTFVLKASASGYRVNTYSYSWTVDTVAPAAPTLSAVNSPTSATSVSVTLSDSDVVDHYTCSLDDAASASICGAGTGTFTASGLADGQHQLTVSAYDAAGNASSPSIATWVVDSTAPNSPTIDTPPAPTSNVVSSSIAFHDDDTSYSSFTCTLDGSVQNNCVSPFTYGPLAEGTHSFSVTATDALGNLSDAASSAWSIDLTPADPPTIVTAPATTTDDTSATVSFTDGDADAIAFRCRLDGGAWAACDNRSVSYTGLASGQHTVGIESLDEVGNSSTETAMSWTVDPNAYPPAAFASGPSSPSSDAAPSFTFDINPASSQTPNAFICTLTLPDSTVSTDDCTNTFDTGYTPSVAPLSLNGTYTLSVVVQYLDSNNATQSSTQTSYAWLLDTVAPPAPQISSGPVGTVATTSASFSFADAERGVAFTCTLDGAAVPCATPRAYTGLAQGQHTFSLVATDAAGNTSPVTQRTWTVDTTRPDAPVVTGASGTSTQQPTISFSDSDPTVTFTCGIDGGAASPCSSPWTVPSPLTYDTHSVVVTATDPAGNAAASAPYSFTLAAPVSATQPEPTPTTTPTSNPPAPAAPVTASGGSAADTTAPTVSKFTTPTTLTGAATATFRETVTGLTASAARLVVAGSTTSIPSKTVCLNGATVVDCGGQFTVVRLTPAGSLVLGQRYTVVLDAGATHDLAGNASAAASAAFRAARTVEESNGVVKAAWQKVSNKRAYDSSYVQEHLAGATAAWTFTGTNVTWWTITGPTMGKATLLVDGKAKATFNNYAATPKFHVARTVKGLKNAKHTVTVKVLGLKGAKTAKGTFVALDAFTVGKTRTATPALATTLRSISSKSFLGGHATVADVKGETITVIFRGTSITWTTMKSVTQGKAAVYVDGKLKATYDDYAAKTAYKVNRSISKLADKVHTLKIVVLGTHHKGGKGNVVTVDQFKVS